MHHFLCVWPSLTEPKVSRPKNKLTLIELYVRSLIVYISSKDNFIEGPAQRQVGLVGSFQCQVAFFLGGGGTSIRDVHNQ